MQADADICGRLQFAATRRRAPLWIAAILPWVLLLSLPGVAAWSAWAVWDCRRLRARVERDWSGWTDAAVPALEDSSALLAGATSAIGQLQRRRLLARLATALTDDVLAAIARERVRLDARWLALSVCAALALFAWRLADALPPAPHEVKALIAKQTSEITVRVTPPGYTGVARSEGAPRELQVPEHSVVEWCLRAPQPVDTPVELSDGQSLRIGRECARWTATESVFWRWRGARYKLRVIADQAPEVTMSAPREMIHTLARDAANAAIALAVRDDYQVRRATLHLTLARGSGENIRFSDRELPLPESSDPRTRNWHKQWTLAELGMEPGDELYFFVRATDNAERAHTTVSPTYTLRLPGPVEESDESSAQPMLVKPENLRSQRQIIIDTEQLLADLKAAPGMNQATLRARSESIADDQAQLRRRYGQFLGEESTLFGGEEHHDDDEKHDVVAEFGHAHDQAENATLFDESTKKILRRALSAMWDAEKALRAIAPKTALPPEYKALDAIKQLQQADRIYLHKTAFVPPPLKEEIRMTGDVVGAKGYRREQATAAMPVPDEVRRLIEALDGDGALPALWSRGAHEWIRERIANDEQRLEAQRAVQDVADGCAACRPVLRAWLRGAISGAPVLLQARAVPQTPFTRALRNGAPR
ncbi:DUF4175 domain-containing protein [Massilia atriviolacea]|uniref:DUF4175 family protein n=1 Tax=Massilia atriviolacea TaxID=2495579 RepID=A0A430HE35_9BURK|nr:DUF4175 family protein [Massilia atriviolacea]RSZ55785.1 hypothetical protein EJB06_27485 [Massilia atriviolacea]